MSKFRAKIRATNGSANDSTICATAGRIGVRGSAGRPGNNNIRQSKLALERRFEFHSSFDVPMVGRADRVGKSVGSGSQCRNDVENTYDTYVRRPPGNAAKNDAPSLAQQDRQKRTK